MAPVTYTARVAVTGEGRNGGTARSEDGLLEHTLAIPKELGGAGGATNPEQLLAAGWAACFLGALRRAAATRHIRLTSTAITAEITLTHGDDGEFSLSATLSPVLGGVDRTTARELAEAAHQICPYSKATRGNIPVTIDATTA
ncbi:organic hydroperoxide resistance protein [Streptomyces sp. Tu 6176]|uniref:organic hydroperoxide resistance protein n=2 Tax=unclassified Streptomyces TaxID=2593676 RepID=UPI0004500ABD|nr:organic hydroperoxide resistance protein [Streptomyces sp. Tu 6176]EYT81802.1 organic hydroperoxide resistance protein [Streptomyces sp. Tu 6176]